MLIYEISGRGLFKLFVTVLALKVSGVPSYCSPRGTFRPTPRQPQTRPPREMSQMDTEAKLLAGVLATETHTRLAVGEQLIEYFKDNSNSPANFEELDRLIAGLAAWMGSSHFKVSELVSEERKEGSSK